MMDFKQVTTAVFDQPEIVLQDFGQYLFAKIGCFEN